MPTLDRIYLDNAATSWPKPPQVYDAVDDYQRRLGVSAGRGAYAEAQEVEREFARARSSLAHLFGASDPNQIVFTLNGSDALNLAIHGLIRPGDHVVTTVCEHNSVLRPLRFLEEERDVAVTRVGCDAQGRVDPNDIQAAITSKTRLVAMIHASNVTGALQPVAEVGEIVRKTDALFLVDVAQTAGHVPINVSEMNIDLLATPGHKGLLGPQGTGLLCLGPSVAERITSIRQGGTGTQSDSDRQPATLPDKYESGSHNAPGIFGLAAGVDYLMERGVEDIRRHGQDLTRELMSGLAEIPELRLYGPGAEGLRVGVVSFTVEGFDPQEVAAMLDSSHRVQARAGIHCAPLMHNALGATSGGGTVRLSLGPFTTNDDIQHAIEAVREIAMASLGC